MRASEATPARRAGIAGFALALPFLALNLVVAERIEPLFSLIRPGEHTGPLEYPLLFLVLSLLPVGAAVALTPLWRGARRPLTLTLALANVLVAAVLIVAFLAIAIALGSEIYRCEVLRIPNCD